MKSVFKSFREKMKTKKKLHYIDKDKSGMNISVLKNKVRDSELMRYLRELARTSHITMHNHPGPYLFSTFKSIKPNLNSDNVRKVTMIAKYVNWDKYHEDVRAWMKDNLAEDLNNEMLNYFKTKLPYSLSAFDPKILVNSLLSYGHNSGTWEQEALLLWKSRAREMMREFTWTDENLLDLSSDYSEIENVDEGWRELLLAQPMFSIMRHDATSSWPDYHPQTMEYILRTYWDAINAAPEGIVTMYHRRHGYTLVIDKRNVGVIVLKVRFVGGVEYVTKVHGLYVTWSFKMSKPTWTAYYRPWTSIFGPLVADLERSEGWVFTSDQKMHDAHHHRPLLLMLKEIVSEKAPSHIKTAIDLEYAGSFEDPSIQVSPHECIKLGRDIATSGSPSIPLYESISTDSAHTVGLEHDQNLEILTRVIQIDDDYYEVDKEPDIDRLAKYMVKKFGAEISPIKTEKFWEHRYVTLLQVNLGELYLRPQDQVFLVPELVKTDRTFYLGHIARRLHRENDRERMKTSGLNDIRWEYEDDELADFRNSEFRKPVEQILGSLSSHGPLMPESLLQLKIKHLSGYRTDKSKFNPIWAHLVEFIKAGPRYKLGDYGFDPRFMIEYLGTIY